MALMGRDGQMAAIMIVGGASQGSSWLWAIINLAFPCSVEIETPHYKQN